MKGRYLVVQQLGDLADRGGADPLAQDGHQRFADLAGRQPECEAGQDQAVDVALAAGVGLQHGHRAEAPSARHAQLEVAERGQEVAPIGAVAPVAHPVALGLRQVTPHLALHVLLQDPAQGLAAQLMEVR